VAGIIVLITVVLGILALARSWPRSSGEGSSPSRRSPRPPPWATPYRVPGDDGARRDVEDGRRTFHYLDPVLPLDERILGLDLYRTYVAALARADAAAIVRAARHVLERARGSGLRAHATEILAHGHALAGDHVAAVDALDAIPGGHRPNPLVHAEVLLRARRYDAAHRVIAEARAEADSPVLTRLAARALREAAAWAEAERRRHAET
jgi:hypothetical protein